MPHADYRETEVKLFWPDLTDATAALESAGATLAAARVFERNVRLTDAAGQMRERGAVLRLRQDTRVRLTYKEDSEERALVQGGSGQDDGIRSRFEAEVEVSDLPTMQTILERLGFRPYMTYEKYRTTYTLDRAEIVLDELPYGNFIEIEGDEATIRDLLSRFGWADAPRFPGSYTVLFDLVKRALNLPFDDLTFANFQGVELDLAEWFANGNLP